jgi:hypothetical protein
VIDTVESWAMVVLLLAASVLLVGAVLEQEWLWGAVWTIALAVDGAALRRRRGRSA